MTGTDGPYRSAPAWEASEVYVVGFGFVLRISQVRPFGYLIEPSGTVKVHLFFL